jgi:hypothetical protein
MKKLLHIAALTIAISASAQAQVHFGPDSTRPINPRAATRDLERQKPNQAKTTPQRVLVECRDGSRHIARVCRRHGGVVRSKTPD